MKDAFERDIHPGDTVVYIEPRQRSLSKEKVLRLTAAKVVVGYPIAEKHQYPGCKPFAEWFIDPWMTCVVDEAPGE